MGSDLEKGRIRVRSGFEYKVQVQWGCGLSKGRSYDEGWS